jgi:hypothetical protein
MDQDDGWVTDQRAIDTLIAIGELKTGDEIVFAKCPGKECGQRCHGKRWVNKVFTIEELE